MEMTPPPPQHFFPSSKKGFFLEEPKLRQRWATLHFDPDYLSVHTVGPLPQLLLLNPKFKSVSNDGLGVTGPF